MNCSSLIAPGYPGGGNVAPATRLVKQAIVVLATALYTAGYAFAVDFDPEEVSLDSNNFYDASVLEGPHYRVNDTMINRGLMNNYTIQSDFGEYKVNSNEALPYRIAEIQAIAVLQTMSRTEAFANAMKDAAKRPVAVLQNLAHDPVETAKGIPDGVSRLFYRTKRVVSDTYEEIDTYVQEKRLEPDNPQPTNPDEPSTFDKGIDAGQEYGKDKLGYNRAIRKVAKQLGVDPYTDNAVLQEEMASMAWVMAAGSLAMGSVIPSLPGEIGYLTDINDLVWDVDPLDLRIRNEEMMRNFGTREAVITSLYESDYFTTTTRTRFIASLNILTTASGLPILVEHAALAEDQGEARFFGRMGETLGLYHQSRSEILQIFDTSALPLAVTDSRVLVNILPVDYLLWTPNVRDYAVRLDREVKERAPGYTVEVWVEGLISELARKNLMSLGWIINDQSIRRLSLK